MKEFRQIFAFFQAQVKIFNLSTDDPALIAAATSFGLQIDHTFKQFEMQYRCATNDDINECSPWLH